MNQIASLNRTRTYYEQADAGLLIFEEAAKRNRQRVKRQMNEVRQFIVAVSLVRLKK